MADHYTNAEEMARRAGLPNGKTFRSRLRKRHPELHTPGDWGAAIGSHKHQIMVRELEDMLRAQGT